MIHDYCIIKHRISVQSTCGILGLASGLDTPRSSLLPFPFGSPQFSNIALLPTVGRQGGQQQPGRTEGINPLHSLTAGLRGEISALSAPALPSWRLLLPSGAPLSEPPSLPSGPLFSPHTSRAFFSPQGRRLSPQGPQSPLKVAPGENPHPGLGYSPGQPWPS